MEKNVEKNVHTAWCFGCECDRPLVLGRTSCADCGAPLVLGDFPPAYSPRTVVVRGGPMTTTPNLQNQDQHAEQD